MVNRSELWLEQKALIRYIKGMTTVAEIETAVELLPRESLDELAAWLVEYHASLNASAEIFHQYDTEETGADSQWIGE